MQSDLRLLINYYILRTLLTKLVLYKSHKPILIPIATKNNLMIIEYNYAIVLLCGNALSFPVLFFFYYIVILHYFRLTQLMYISTLPNCVIIHCRLFTSPSSFSYLILDSNPLISHIPLLRLFQYPFFHLLILPTNLS